MKKNKFVEVRRSNIQGTGVFSLKKINKGVRIIEYTGKRINPEEEVIRYDEDLMDRHHTYLFEIDNKETIDGNDGGNEARYINHSCAPNCESVNEEGRIFIEAIRTIFPGEEITYDYNYEVEGRVSKKERSFYLCHCGADDCRGTILNIKPPKKRTKK